MKKKICLLLVLITIMFISTGCFKRDEMENINVITTIYPIQYVIERLYGDSSNIVSIYPKGLTLSVYYEGDNNNKFTLTKKQLKDFSSYDLFVYNGESNEREYATYMLNQNKNLKIIDAAYSLNATNVPSDVWIKPSNMLMIGENIINELKNYISNPYIIEEIEDKYGDLKLDISKLEAEFRNTGKNSVYKTIVTSDETLMFLEKYGFTVLNITENGEIIEKNITAAKQLYASGLVNYVFIHENEVDNQTAIKVLTDYGFKTKLFRTVELLTEDDLANGNDYLLIMYENIANLKEETYK